jgi:putative membrane protein
MMFGNGFNGGGFQGIGNCLGCAGGYMHGGLFILAFLLFATLALLGTLFLVKHFKSNRADNIVMETLKMKLVSGEITEEEYISKKNVLK